MRNILFIAQGQIATDVADRCLREEHVLVTRVRTAAEANGLLAQGPVDAIVCAIDELNESGRACLELIEYLGDTPTVILLRKPLPIVRTLRINISIVAVDDGLEPIRTAICQQLRRGKHSETAFATPPEFEFSFVIPARPDRIARARTVAGSFVQRSIKLPDYELLKLELVIEEALANAVYHGSLEIESEQRMDPVLFAQLLEERTAALPYCDRKVCIDLAIDDTRLQIVVKDEGPGFDPESITAGTEEDTVLLSSGRGLMLMRAFADSLSFNERGNEVRVTKLRSSLSPDACSETVPAPLSLRSRTLPAGNFR